MDIAYVSSVDSSVNPKQPLKKVISINGEMVDANDIDSVNIHDFTTFEQEDLFTGRFMSLIRRKTYPQSGDKKELRKQLSFQEVAREVVRAEHVLLAFKQYKHRDDSDTDDSDEEGGEKASVKKRDVRSLPSSPAKKSSLQPPSTQLVSTDSYPTQLISTQPLSTDLAYNETPSTPFVSTQSPSTQLVPVSQPPSQLPSAGAQIHVSSSARPQSGRSIRTSKMEYSVDDSTKTDTRNNNVTRESSANKKGKSPAATHQQNAHTSVPEIIQHDRVVSSPSSSLPKHDLPNPSMNHNGSKDQVAQPRGRDSGSGSTSGCPCVVL